MASSQSSSRHPLQPSTSMQEICICYGLDGHNEINVDIDDLDVDLLVEHFNLTFKPSSLFYFDGMKKKVVNIKNKEKMRPGHKYYLARRNANGQGDNSHSPSPGPTLPNRNLWDKAALAESIQNSVVAAKAVYSEDDDVCRRFLSSNMSDHSLAHVTRTHYGKCVYLMAEDLERRTLYVAFRGSQSGDDWKDNLTAYQVEGSQAVRMLQGKFHAGFLARAQLFPIDKILNEEYYRGRDIVLCGHSLGGAVASVVAILLQIELDKRQQAEDEGNRRRLRCITFGAPIIGNDHLREFCNKKGISRNMFHFVSDDDPVPRILSYSHSLSAISSMIDAQVRSLTSTYATKEAASFYKDQYQALIADKQHYMQILSKVGTIMEPALDAAQFVFPKYAGALLIGKASLGVINDMVQSSNQAGKQSPHNVYVPIGNYLFVGRDNATVIPLDFVSDDQIQRCFELPLNKKLSDTAVDIPIYHGIDNYEYFSHKWAGAQGKFPRFVEHTIIMHGEVVQTIVAREIKFVCQFLPVINCAELIRVQSFDDDILRLRLTGVNLYNYVLDQCCFSAFGFPFGREGKVRVKKVTSGTNLDTIVLEEPFVESPSIADHGSLIKYTTQFGSCDYLLKKEHVRNIHIDSVRQMAYQDSISLLIKRAILRGMAISQIRRVARGQSDKKKENGSGNWKACDEKIIQEILRLAAVTLGKKNVADLDALFADSNKHVQFLLSNEEEFKRIQGYCDSIQNYLKQPLHIYAEKGVLKKIGITVATLAGAALMAYCAGPGLIVIGAIEAISITATGTAGVIGGLGAGLITNKFLNSKMADENYQQVLKFVTFQLLKKLEKDTKMDAFEKGRLLQEVSDLREEGSTFSQEKALLLMYDQRRGLDNFVDCDLQYSTTQSKLDVIKRIECVKTIHNIRNVFAKQCYIGIVGLQNAGKTTLLNKLWGTGCKTGSLFHTDIPMIYEIDPKVLVVDFPGSNSLDFHAKTFSNCGAMNNLIVIVVPFTGDINQEVLHQLSQVFSVMAGSDSSKVLLCVNQCGHFLPQVIRDELADQDDPVDFMRERYATRLNDHYQSIGSSFVVSKESILFTDWLATEEDLGGLGICGVEDVRMEIRQYLVKHGVFDGKKERDTEALERCLHTRLNFGSGSAKSTTANGSK